VTRTERGVLGPGDGAATAHAPARETGIAGMPRRGRFDAAREGALALPQLGLAARPPRSA